MGRRMLIIVVGAGLVSAAGVGPAWARADNPTWTETCGGSTTAVVDAHAGPSLKFADTKFDDVAGTKLNFFCDTAPTG